jgi:hypothetical protein
MKRVFAVLVLLAVAAGLYAASGKIYLRYGVFEDKGAPAGGQYFRTGPMASYWGNPANNVDLWQGKDGTGFDINADSFGITYRMRELFTIPFSLDTAGYDERGWGAGLQASSPGYLQIRDIKAGPLSMSIGLAWWQAMASKYNFQTNITGGATNADTQKDLNYQRFYLDYKFMLTLGDAITIKQMDWEMMHFEFDFGSDRSGGTGGKVTNDLKGGSSLLAFVPLRVLVNTGMIGLDIHPQFVYKSSSTYDNNGVGGTNKVDNARIRFGGTVTANIALIDWLGLNATVGYYSDSSTTFDRVDNGASTITTNAGGSTSSASMVIPFFAALKFKLGPGINMWLGYGYNFVSTTSINNLTFVTQTTAGFVPRYGSYNFNDIAEFGYYGDSFMDIGFLKFGGDVKFAQGWSMGLAAGVALNDKWQYTWWMLGQGGYNTTTTATTVTASGNNQILSFLNMFNYDNQMYIKYEDDKVAIKGTFMGERSYFLVNQYGPWPNEIKAYAPNLFGFFAYMDFTVKF